MNIEAMLGVADLIEEKNRFTLAAWAVFLDGTTGTWSIAGYRDGRRKPTIDEMLHDPGCYGCIGGWTNVWAGHEDGVDGLEDWHYATRVLGLELVEARRLFFAAQDNTLWRQSGKLAGWSGGVYKSITGQHAATMLRLIVAGDVRIEPSPRGNRWHPRVGLIAPGANDD